MRSNKKEPEGTTTVYRMKPCEPCEWHRVQIENNKPTYLAITILFGVILMALKLAGIWH